MTRSLVRRDAVASQGPKDADQRACNGAKGRVSCPLEGVNIAYRYDGIAHAMLPTQRTGNTILNVTYF
ncbi:MAG: hypothetical protein HON65_04615 [Rhodospirillales bacterium]|nr:hypothetical protein [Rhodospirillales bacterium]